MNKLFIFVLLSLSVIFADSYVNVRTPRGSNVQVRYSSWDHNTATKIATDNSYKSQYPRAQFLSSTTRYYNCHSYAWYSASTANYFWMNNPSPYWTDGSYSQIPGGSSLSNNDRILYVKGSTVAHSALFRWGSTVESKWGQAPLMRHRHDECPYWPKYSSLYGFR